MSNIAKIDATKGVLPFLWALGRIDLLSKKKIKSCESTQIFLT